MNKQTLKTEVRQFVVDNFLMGASAAELRDGDSFMASHVIDSVGVLELVSFLEKKYGIKVEDQEMLPENLDSLNAIERYLVRKLNGRARPASWLGDKMAWLGVVWTMIVDDPLIECIALALAL